MPNNRQPAFEPWAVDSWRAKLAQQQVRYPDREAVERAVARLRALPPLVTSWEIERLKANLGEAESGKRFLLQGGDCAETLADCRPAVITNKLKILLQMSLVLVQSLKTPVIRVGRLAGQYAKPRSSEVERREGENGAALELPSYFGDLVNRAEFTAEARRADPELMVEAYQHAALTLNFVRALVDGGFADAHHPDYWDLSFFEHASLSPETRAEYERMAGQLAEALEFMEAMGETSVSELTRVDFYTSHEGLNLHYESAQTRRVPRRPGVYTLSTHMPWIGDRTRTLDGAHVEFFRGIENPVGVKIGPSATGAEVVALTRALNPKNEAGKLALIVRLGADRVEEGLPKLIDAVRGAQRRGLWVCDPMHGNMIKTGSGVKTRSFDMIVEEIERSIDVHKREGSILGGVHFELTGEDVTECVGGAAGVTEADLSRNYTSLCDPRLNYQQSLELALHIGRRMRRRSNGNGGGREAR